MYSIPGVLLVCIAQDSFCLEFPGTGIRIQAPNQTKPQPNHKTLFRPQLESHSQKQQTGTEAMHEDIIRTSFLIPYKKSLEELNLILTK